MTTGFLNFTSNGVAVSGNTANVSLDISAASDAVALPIGNTVQRPVGSPGQIRFNTDANQYEGFYLTSWNSLANANAIVGGSNGQIQFNSSGSFGANANLTWNIAISQLAVSGPGGTFTGNTAVMPLAIRTSTSGTSNVGVDFTDNQLFKGRIAVQMNGSGSVMSFGTSNNYNFGITNQGIILDFNSNVTLGNGVFFVKSSNVANMSGSLNVSNTIFIVGDIGSQDSLTLHNQNTTDGRCCIAFIQDRGTTQQYEFGIDPGGAATRNFSIRDLTAAGAPIRVALANTGNLGIGTSSPTSNLHVVGNVRATTGINAATMNTSTLNVTGIIFANASPLTNTTTQTLTGISAVKKTATAYTSVAVLAADANLQLTFNETGWYDFELFLPVNATSNGFGGFQFDFGSNTATTANICYQVSGYSNVALAVAAAITTNTTVTSAGNVSTSVAAPSWFLAKGSFTITGTGTFGPRFAQATSTSNAVNLMQGAYFEAVKQA